jgi:hypothetical protein
MWGRIREVVVGIRCWGMLVICLEEGEWGTNAGPSLLSCLLFEVTCGIFSFLMAPPCWNVQTFWECSGLSSCSLGQEQSCLAEAPLHLHCPGRSLLSLLPVQRFAPGLLGDLWQSSLQKHPRGAPGVPSSSMVGYQSPSQEKAAQGPACRRLV